MKKKVLIFVVSYNAEDFIRKVLLRIPENVYNNDRFETEILIIDDCSADRTFYEANNFSSLKPDVKFTVLHNPVNQGYGGNQKIGYYYAIENNFDLVVLLHGDGQYPPEVLLDLISPILDDEADIILASRMINRGEALKGGMPLYKWFGNQILTTAQNIILRQHLSEYHTGYRAYRVRSLQKVPYNKNSDYFDFDTDILIQLMDTGNRIKEISIPTHYGDEICHVNGLRYGALIIFTSLISRIMRMGIFYDARFDYSHENEQYSSKIGFSSSQQYAVDYVKEGSTILDLGCGPGFMAQALSEKKQVKPISVDRYITDQARRYSYKTIEADLDEYDFGLVEDHVDTILALDIIEHLDSPELFLSSIREHFSREGTHIVLTTGNVAFLLTRLSLLLGQFNYSNHGVLDLDHHRLFTFASFRKLLKTSGYVILEEKGIPAPFPLALGDNWVAALFLKLNQFLIHLSKGLFSYQMAFVAYPKPTLQCLLEDAYRGRSVLLEKSGEIG